MNGFISVCVMFRKLAKHGGLFVMLRVASYNKGKSLIEFLCQDTAQRKIMEVPST